MQAAELLRKKSLSPVELTVECLKQIERLNPALNAFITVTNESALAEARRMEEEIQRGEYRGPLHGIPVGLKDLIDTAGVRTTAASALFKDRIPTADAAVVSRLRACGAVLLGKQNLHEFAYGGSSVVSYFGPVRNARNPEHIAGGSSGGSAAAVAAGMCFAAIGTDTAGSIREPAALCGVVGLKPTYGRVSARGVIPLSTSLDHLGPITKSVRDAAAVFAAITGGGFTSNSSTDIRSLRIGVPREFFFDQLDPEVDAAVENALSVLRRLVKEVREVALSVPADRTLQAAESYAYHAERVEKSPEMYQAETLRRILTGKDVSAERTQELRQELARERLSIHAIFDDVDVLVTPTTPAVAPTVAELLEKPELLRSRELLLLRNTRPFNVWGLPTVSVPCGLTRAGLPIGLQIAGRAVGEDTVLAVAEALDTISAT